MQKGQGLFEVPLSLCTTVLSEIVTPSVPAARIPSPIAFSAVKPRTVAPAAPGPKTVMALTSPSALMIAPGMPTRRTLVSMRAPLVILMFPALLFTVIDAEPL